MAEFAEPEASRLGVTSVNSLLARGPLSPQLGHRCRKAITSPSSPTFIAHFCVVGATICVWIVPAIVDQVLGQTTPEQKGHLCKTEA